MKVDKHMIACRATSATKHMIEFRKSYIKNANQIAIRDMNEIWQGAEGVAFERDYEFTYKGLNFIVAQNMLEHFVGDYVLFDDYEDYENWRVWHEYQIKNENRKEIGR